MSNKVNNSLDFRNVKKTQFDSAQTLKLSFSELQSGLRTFATNAILKDGFTHFSQTLNSDGYPTHVEYWQASKPSISQLTLGADINGSLRSTYIVMEEYLTKRTVALYCVVGGTGIVPAVADLEVAVVFEENDSVAVVTNAFLNAINNNLDGFIAEKVGTFASSNKLNIEFQQFGNSSPINVGTTGFSTNIVQSGESFKVGEIYLTYDADGNPIFKGSTLKGLSYNPYTASFDSVDINTKPFNDVDYGVKDVTNSATLLAVGASNKQGRRNITIQPKGKTIWYGFDNTVTSGNSGKSFKLTSNSFASIMLGPGEELYALTSNGVAKVAISEAK